jgi:hypothetical protein
MEETLANTGNTPTYTKHTASIPFRSYKCITSTFFLLLFVFSFSPFRFAACVKLAIKKK